MILREWLAFHRAVGFEKIILIDNGSTDETVRIVETFYDRESVDIISRPDRATQVDLYNSVLSLYADKCQWIAFIDADEFLFPVGDTDIRNTIASFGDVGAIAAHWMIYGSNGHVKHPEGLMIDNFTRRAPDDFVFNRHVKSIVNVKHAFRALTSHLFEVKYGIFDDAGNDLHMNPPFGFFEEKQPTFNKLRINHYHTRSKEYYWTKSKRGYFGVDDAKLENDEKLNMMFSSHDQNDIEDTSAQKYKPLMKVYLQEK